jgi:hypothetical protein
VLRYDYKSLEEEFGGVDRVAASCLIMCLLCFFVELSNDVSI